MLRGIKNNLMPYKSGRKVIQERLGYLQRERDALKSATQVYGVAEGLTHGKALAALHEAYDKGKASLQPLFVRDDGSSIARQLNFEETIDTLVNDFESGKGELLMLWNNTCTAHSYKGGTSRFRIVPVSRELVLLSEDFSSPFVSADYARQDGHELDINQGEYNVPLPKSRVLKNPGWLESVKDRSLLKAFRDIVYAKRAELGMSDTAMAYHVWQNPQQDYLRVLEVNGIKDGSNADINYGLDSPARFIIVSPKL